MSGPTTILARSLASAKGSMTIRRQSSGACLTTYYQWGHLLKQGRLKQVGV